MKDRPLSRSALKPEDQELLQQTMQRRRGELEIRGGGPSQLAGALREVIARRKIGRMLESQELTQLWRSVVEADVAERTRVLSVRNRALIVEVSDSVLLSELANFQQRSILRKLQQSRPDLNIKTLKLRLNERLGPAAT
jgi:hypothetical protein